MRNITGAVMAVWIGVSASALAGDAAVSISAGWILAAPPTSHAVAGYMTIDNIGTGLAKVVGVTSPVFSRIAIHGSKQEDGMMRMRAVSELRIASGERLVLQPGGMHLMLVEPNAPLQLGDTVAVRVILDGAEPIDVLLTVRSNPW